MRLVFCALFLLTLSTTEAGDTKETPQSLLKKSRELILSRDMPAAENVLVRAISICDKDPVLKAELYLRMALVREFRSTKKSWMDQENRDNFLRILLREEKLSANEASAKQHEITRDLSALIKEAFFTKKKN